MWAKDLERPLAGTVQYLLSIFETLQDFFASYIWGYLLPLFFVLIGFPL